jgi:hypothetical protein
MKRNFSPVMCNPDFAGLLSLGHFLKEGAIEGPSILVGSNETGISSRSIWLLAYALIAPSALFLNSVR